MKWFWILLVLSGLYWYFKKDVKENIKNVQENIETSAPVRYTESLRQSRDKARRTADQANELIQKNTGELNKVAEEN